MCNNPRGKLQCKNVMVDWEKYTCHLKEVHGFPAHIMSDGWSPLLTEVFNAPSDEPGFLDMEKS